MSISRRTLLTLNFCLALAFLVMGAFTVHAEREVRQLTYASLQLPVLDSDRRGEIQKIQSPDKLRALALDYYDLLYSSRITKHWNAVTVLEYLRYMTLIVAAFFVLGGVLVIAMPRDPGAATGED